MRVLIFTQQFGKRWSGVGTYATNLVAGLIKRGVEVTVVCPEGMSAETPDIEVLQVAMKGWEKKVNYWPPLAWRFGIALRSICARERFDLAHFTDAREALFSPKRIIPLVGTVNDYYPASCPLNPAALKPYYSEWPSRWIYWRAVRLVEPLAYRKLAGLAANSRYVKDIISKAYRLNPARVEVVNYGIDGVDTNEETRLDGDPSILFVGANFQRKGLGALLEAVARVKQSKPGVALYVVGDDPRRGSMEEYARRLGVVENVNFMGGKPNEEVRRMRPDIFAMPSLIEGFGIVFMEFMLAGAPVIGGRTGGTVELITDGENGFTVRPGDSEELASKILRLADDEGLRERFIRKGLETASLYTTDRMVEGTLELYQKIIRTR